MSSKEQKQSYSGMSYLWTPDWRAPRRSEHRQKPRTAWWPVWRGMALSPADSWQLRCGKSPGTRTPRMTGSSLRLGRTWRVIPRLGRPNSRQCAAAEGESHSAEWSTRQTGPSVSYWFSTAACLELGLKREVQGDVCWWHLQVLSELSAPLHERGNSASIGKCILTKSYESVYSILKRVNKQVSLQLFSYASLHVT